MGGKLASGVHIRFAHTKEVLKGISLVSRGMGTDRNIAGVISVHLLVSSLRIDCLDRVDEV